MLQNKPMEKSAPTWQVPSGPRHRPRVGAYCLALIFVACQDPVPPNRAPVSSTPIPDQELSRGNRTQIPMSSHFSDPDGDPLTYTATSSNAEVAALSVSGATVTVVAETQGTATATITATDPGGLSASQNFLVTIPNRSPEVAAPIALERIGNGEPVTLDMSQYFSDPDGDPLTYTAASSDSEVLRLSVSGAEVEVMPVSLGTATGTVTATDPGGLSAFQSFTVTVVPSERDALAALYKATNGDDWANNANWLTDRPLGQWFGVQVTAGHVTRIHLANNNLSGTIPPEAANLGNLQFLELGHNNIEGEIPPEIGNLTELWYLSLGSNRLTGEIPPELRTIL